MKTKISKNNSEYLSISTIEELHERQKFLQKEIALKETKLKFDLYYAKNVLNPLNIVGRILNNVNIIGQVFQFAIKGFEMAKDSILRTKSSFSKSKNDNIE